MAAAAQASQMRPRRCISRSRSLCTLLCLPSSPGRLAAGIACSVGATGRRWPTQLATRGRHAGECMGAAALAAQRARPPPPFPGPLTARLTEGRPLHTRGFRRAGQLCAEVGGSQSGHIVVQRPVALHLVPARRGGGGRGAARATTPHHTKGQRNRAVQCGRRLTLGQRRAAAAAPAVGAAPPSLRPPPKLPACACPRSSQPAPAPAAPAVGQGERRGRAARRRSFGGGSLPKGGSPGRGRPTAGRGAPPALP